MLCDVVMATLTEKSVTFVGGEKRARFRPDHTTLVPANAFKGC